MTVKVDTRVTGHRFDQSPPRVDISGRNFRTIEVNEPDMSGRGCKSVPARKRYLEERARKIAASIVAELTNGSSVLELMSSGAAVRVARSLAFDCVSPAVIFSGDVSPVIREPVSPSCTRTRNSEVEWVDLALTQSPEEVISSNVQNDGMEIRVKSRNLSDSAFMQELSVNKAELQRQQFLTQRGAQAHFLQQERNKDRAELAAWLKCERDKEAAEKNAELARQLTAKVDAWLES